MRHLLSIAAVLGILVCTLYSQVVDNAGIVPMNTDTRNTEPRRPKTSSNKIIQASSNSPNTGNGVNYNGGPVMPGPHNVYFIWYGNWVPYSSTQTILPQFISGLNLSPYFDIDAGYSDSNGNWVQDTVTMAGQISDNYSQGTSLTDTGLANVVSRAVVNHLLPYDGNGVYFVLTSPDVTNSSSSNGGSFCSKYCGFHTTGLFQGHGLEYAFVGDPVTQCPYVPSQPGCSTQNPTPNGDQGADAMATVIAHELNETVTDPSPPTGWVSSSGEEIADLCTPGGVWHFGNTFTVPVVGQPGQFAQANVVLGGKNYLIQQTWVNAGGGYCEMQWEGGPGYDSNHVIFIDSAGHLREHMNIPGAGWVSQDETFASSIEAGTAPTPVSGTALTTFVDSLGIHFEFIGTDQNVYQTLYLASGSTNHWQIKNVTSQTGAPLAGTGSALTSEVNTAGEHVFYLGANQHVYELLWSGSAWSVNDLMVKSGASNTAAAGSALTSYVNSTGQHVFYLGTNQHVYTLYNGGSSWLNTDITTTSGASNTAAAGSALTSYVNSTGQHVFYLGTNQHVYTLYNGGSGWLNTDITTTSGASNTAASGSALTSEVNSTGQHAFYIGTNQHVYELYNGGSGWVNNDLTVNSGATVTAVTGSALTGDVTNSGQHVFYIGSNGHIQALFWNATGGGWTNNDLTSQIGGTPKSGTALASLDWQ